MLKSLALAALLAGTGAAAAPADEALKAVTTVLDKFNAGDVQAFIDAHAADAVILDEFAPYQWSGQGSVQRWLDDYGKDSTARKISDGHMAYGRPSQAGSDGSSAYVVLPTTYCMTQAGVRKGAEGHMTFILTRTDAGWKIASWAYAAPQPTTAVAKAGKCGKAK